MRPIHPIAAVRRLRRGPGWMRLVFWALATAVTVLSLTPVEHLPPRVFDWWDKAQHALGFAVLALTARLAYPAPRGVVLVAGLLLHGAAIEWAQAASGWRHGEVADWVADAVGVALGWVVVVALRRINAPSRAKTH